MKEQSTASQWSKPASSRESRIDARTRRDGWDLQFSFLALVLAQERSEAGLEASR